MAKKSGLGKGLSAIFMENESEDQNNTVTLNISEIEPNKDQPRMDFDDESLAELAESISKHGILQPLLVRPLLYGVYQIVAGERRYRASRMAGLTEVPVVIRELDDKETMEIALIENLQRENLTPVEEAKGYKTLMDTYGFTQEQVSESVGKSRSAVANSLRLLNLPEEVLILLADGRISSGHARALQSLENVADMITISQEILYKDLSVRQTEKITQHPAASSCRTWTGTRGRPLLRILSRRTAFHAFCCRSQTHILFSAIPAALPGTFSSPPPRKRPAPGVLLLFCSAQ